MLITSLFSNKPHRYIAATTKSIHTSLAALQLNDKIPQLEDLQLILQYLRATKVSQMDNHQDRSTRITKDFRKEELCIQSWKLEALVFQIIQIILSATASFKEAVTTISSHNSEFELWLRCRYSTSRSIREVSCVCAVRCK